MVELRAATAVDDAEALGADVDHESPTALRVAAGELARRLSDEHCRVDARGLDGARLTAFAEGLALGCYRFTRASTPPPGPRVIELCGADDEAALAAGVRNAAAACWARDLANTRSNEKTPAWLAARAAEGLTPLGVDVVERDEHWLAEQGFGGMLAVGGGSAAPPRLIEASWRPRGAAAQPHIVLVGKGITFDSGGLNLKRGTGMSTMYTDMSGGAAVLGAVHAVAAARLPVRVTALVPAAQNSMSGTAYRPSDVVRHYGGRTSEIGNTDAEGRLVLADAMAWAVRRLRPSVLVDVATLTGAAKMALGTRTGALFATSDDLAAALVAAGTQAGEPLWRLPLPEDYRSTLDSPIADATNSAGPPGAITAAMFLQPFAGDVPWAHLDIAGPARADEDAGFLNRGATAFAARLLNEYVQGAIAVAAAAAP
ncbi:M17 family metallopeptidase [uncultured Jatrophihabitans sp.]|uniref:leucyl aminopeptidase family protein n=1 Tax=uncultured Jatrophihabitans sp. TaxID=1610747 RepID=UPI0035CC4A82